MKGTYIKVLNDVVFDELEEIRKSKNISNYARTGKKED